MKKNEEDEIYLEKWIKTKVPDGLRENYTDLIQAMKAGFYEGIKFERSKYKGIPGAVCPHCYQQGIQNYDKSSARCPNCGKSIFLNQRKM